MTRGTRTQLAHMLVASLVAGFCQLVHPLAAQAQTPPTDEPPLNIGIFVGSAIDSFAAADLRRYRNPDDSGTFSEQLVAGFDFEYQVASSRKNGSRLWLYGETTHGARSGETDCSKDGSAGKDACKIASLEQPSSLAPLAIFRKATTLEGFVGLRAELFELGPDTARSALYVKGQLGFLSVANKGGDIVDMHQVGLGLRLRGGAFDDSYFELGYGRNDLFERNTGRTKVDAYLTFGRARTPKAKPFFQLCIDSDFGSGPDNIQTFFGLDLDVLELFR